MAGAMQFRIKKKTVDLSRISPESVEGDTMSEGKKSPPESEGKKRRDSESRHDRNSGHAPRLSVTNQNKPKLLQAKSATKDLETMLKTSDNRSKRMSRAGSRRQLPEHNPDEGVSRVSDHEGGRRALQQVRRQTVLNEAPIEKRPSEIQQKVSFTFSKVQHTEAGFMYDFAARMHTIEFLRKQARLKPYSKRSTLGDPRGLGSIVDAKEVAATVSRQATGVSQTLAIAIARDNSLMDDFAVQDLFTCMMDDIVAFKKLAKCEHEWSRRSISDVAARARQIAAYKKQAHCLRVELYNSNMQRKLGTARENKFKGRAEADKILDKAHGALRFWDDYHMSTRLLQNGPVQEHVPPQAIGSSPDCLAHPPESEDDFFRLAKLGGGDAMKKWRNTMSWKGRSMRDVCTHVGWDHARSLNRFNVPWQTDSLLPSEQLSTSESDDDAQVIPAGWRQSPRRRRIKYRAAAATPDSIASIVTPRESCSSSCSTKASSRGQKLIPSLKTTSTTEEPRYNWRSPTEDSRSLSYRPRSEGGRGYAHADSRNNETADTRCTGSRGSDRSYLSGTEGVRQLRNHETSDLRCNTSRGSARSYNTSAGSSKSYLGATDVSHQDSDYMENSVSSTCSPSRGGDLFARGWLDNFNVSGEQSEYGILNPMAPDEFVEPRAEAPSKDSSLRVYMRACAQRKCLPVVMPFMTGQQSKLTSCAKNLRDADLENFAAMIPSMSSLEEVDLAESSQLSDKALEIFLKAIHQHSISHTIHSITLSRCIRASVSTIRGLARLLSDRAGATQLRTLDISGITIGITNSYELCRAVGSHKCLRYLNLSNTGMGGSSNAAMAKKCLTGLFRESHLQELDLGWNHFSGDVFAHLGECLVKTKTVSNLSIPSCAAAGEGVPGMTTLVSFIEHLAKDKTLTKLDMSMNRIDYQGALVVEDALDSHRRLASVNISNNPLGESGIRSLIRLLARRTCGLTSVDLAGCWCGPEPQQHGVVFNPAAPFGRYILDLANPYHRAVLRMLYKTCERLGARHEMVLADTEWSLGSYSHPKKASDGSWPTQSRGRLVVTFNGRKMMEISMTKVLDMDFNSVLQHYNDMMKLKPSFNKSIPLLQQWHSTMDHPKEQSVLLRALTRDFLLDYPLAELLCQNSLYAGEVVQQLLMCVDGGGTAQFLTMLQSPKSMLQYAKVFRQYLRYVCFNPENPTGHYTLSLDDPVDFKVAETLVLLNLWEGVLAQRQRRPDVSQQGNRSQFRNERYQGRPLVVQNYNDWRLPVSEEFDLDYVADKRPPKDCHVINEITLSNILVLVQLSECRPELKIQVLRAVSHHFYIHAMNLRELMESFRDRSARMQLFVLFYFRITDIQHEKIARCKFAPDEIRHLCFQLGFCSLFPYIQPEHWEIHLDCAYHDQRVALQIVNQLASKENRGNLVDFSFILPDGSLDPLPAGVPKTWESYDALPRAGVFRARYKCPPEYRSMQYRKQMMHTYGYWNTKHMSNELMWWMGSSEAPQDVFEFLEFLVARFPNLQAAFIFIDGPGGNQLISISEFEESILEMGCKRFKGADEKSRIRAIYRWLDANNDGRIAHSEFLVLQQMFREVELSIQEFARFLERTWGSSVEDAWAHIDDDQSGEITYDEWLECCQNKGFFGDAKQVFNFIDRDGEGTISFQEFSMLRKFQQTHEPMGGDAKRVSAPQAPISLPA